MMVILLPWEDTEIRTIVVIQAQLKCFRSIGGTTVQTLLVVTGAY